MLPMIVRSWLRLPAVRALMIQCFSFVLVLSLARLGWVMLNVKMDVFVAGVLQGVLAASGARFARLAVWWWVIQFVLPIALLVTWMMHIPNFFFLLSFCFLLVIYWSCFRTQVPYYPSNRFVRDSLVSLIPAGQTLQFIDIGSGLGGVSLYLARVRPNCSCFGIELAPLPWLISYLRSVRGGKTVQFWLGDYGTLDFSRYDIVFAYLSPAAMSQLWHKACQEMRPGTLLLSYEFLICEQAPSFTKIDPCGGPALYGWQF